MSRMSEYSRHPLSAAFPSMPDADYDLLVEDIQAHGLLQPVVLFEGMVLDGWHRYQACLDAEVKPMFEQFKGPDPVAFVLSLNMHRRHLTGSQRAAAVVACSQWAKPGNQPKGAPGAPLKTEAEMAEAAGVGETTIKQAKRAHEAGLGDAVRDGKVTAKEAAAVAKLPEEERQAALEAPKPKPEPKPIPSEAKAYVQELEAKLANLEAENEDLKDRLQEMASLMEGLQEEVASAHRVLDAEDLLGQFKKEVVRYQELARVTQARNNGLMDENSDLKGRLKSALRKIERIEKREGAA